MDGIVSIEAENFDANVSQGGHDWVEVFPSGYSGTAAMQAQPNIETNNNSGYESNSPRLDFVVNFVHTGTHYVWLRGIGASGMDDSVHVGLDGTGLASSDRITGFSTNWTWSQDTMDVVVATVDVATSGVHTVNVWMREDGFVIDKIVLTTSASYIPSGEGPAESLRGNSLVFTPDVLSFAVEEGGTTPFQTTDLDTSDSSVASYTVSDDATWLTVTPTSGSTPDTLTVSIDAASLTPGIYTATITATASGYTDATLDVILTVMTTYDLILSLSPDRSNPLPLQDETVSGPIYVFTNPETYVSQVSFYLDDPGMTGSPYQVEQVAPYDFSGTTTGGNANPFNTAQLTDGTHEITALLLLNAGGNIVISSAFTTINTLNLPFNDDFEDGDANGWSVFDDPGQMSDWVVENGEYYQQNPFAGSTFDETYHIGKYSVLSHGYALTDYQFSVKVTTVGSNTALPFEIGNDIGVMFRYQDTNNYFRLSFSGRQGFTRLEKKVNGTFFPLLTNSRGYLIGQVLNITIKVSGSLILVYVNGDPLFGISDSSLSFGSIALYCQGEAMFDNILIEQNNSNSEIVISSPNAHSVTTSDSLYAFAITTNLPSGGWIEFNLFKLISGTETLVDTRVLNSPPYETQFVGLGRGEYMLEANLFDSIGSLLDTDTNERIGVLGNYYVSVGDSITNGSIDNFSNDNFSQDSRIIALQGFEANLNDFLAQSLSNPTYPNIIFNEGIPGDTSRRAANDRIFSILERHPDSNNILILLGTNDAGSGITSPTFKQYMQNLIDSIPSYITAWVGLIPPAFQPDGSPDTTRNQLIEEYNAVINGTDPDPLTGHQEGPDFFSFFLNRHSLFTDQVHPNGFGHVLIAYLWHNVLDPANPMSIPLILENLYPLDYKQNLLEVGDEYYNDESYILASIPSGLGLENGIWVMTANADRFNADLAFLSFDVDRSVTVYVAYDSGALPPAWLSGWNDEQLQVETTNGALNLYSKTFLGGTIDLPGNHADDGTGTANYIVIVVEN